MCQNLRVPEQTETVSVVLIVAEYRLNVRIPISELLEARSNNRFIKERDSRIAIVGGGLRSEDEPALLNVARASINTQKD